MLGAQFYRQIFCSLDKLGIENLDIIGMSIFQDEKIWRILTNVWTAVFLGFLIVNFFLMNRFEYLVVPFSIVYISVLGLYTGTKEFNRWYEMHYSRHPGELFVILWTVVIFFLLGASFFLGKNYKVSSEVLADYIMVLSVFALTQNSKRLYKRKRK